MPEQAYHPLQLKAIRQEGNVIVSAGAGSGKTRVMVARAVKHVQEGMDIGRILMVTFTNAAADEMKQRIQSTLLDQAAAHPDQARYLRQQAARAAAADIGTIDGFCLQLAKDYFHLADIDPLFQIIGEAERAVLRQETLQTLFDGLFDQQDAGFLSLLDLADGRENTLMAQVTAIFDFCRAMPDPAAWRARAAAAYAGGAEPELRSLCAQALGDIQAIVLPILDEIAQAHLAAADAKNRAFGDALLQRVAQLQGAVTTGDAALARQLLGELPSMGSRGIIRNGGLSQASKQLTRERNKLRDNLALRLTLDEHLQRMESMAPYAESLTDLTAAFESAYAARLKQRGFLEFADVEYAAYDILHNEEARAEIAGRYDLVFIDEYQDTNHLQEAILTAVARDNLFCVGDVKQSIYRFRHAEPALFLARDSAYRNDQGGTALDLNRNYRSGRAILDTVNLVMGRNMSAALGGRAYDEGQALVKGGEDKGPVFPVQIRLIDRTEQGPDAPDDEREPAELPAEPGETLAAYEAQAFICAKEIHLLTQQAVDFGDIAVLLPRLSAHGQAFVEILQAAGIPVEAQVKGQYFEGPEIKAMVALLSAIDNSRDELPLLGALHGPAGGFSAADLADIRLSDKQAAFPAAARALAQGEDGLSQKLRDFFNRLDRWRALSQLLPVDELMGLIWDETGFLTHYAALRGGAQKQLNLQQLLNRARAYSTFSEGNLHGFLRMIHSLTPSAGDIPQVVEQSGNRVRVMSVHRSKGLEFKVVFLAGLHCSVSGRAPALLLDNKLGFALKGYDKQRDVMYPLLWEQALQNRRKADDRSEALRLLYVAMTRAMERLFIIGFMPNDAEPKPPETAASPWDWIWPIIAEAGANPPFEAIVCPWPRLGGTGQSTARNWSAEPASEADIRFVESRFGWTPSLPARPQPVKTSVTELLHKQTGSNRLERPAFMGEALGFTPAQTGTLVHRVLRHGLGQNLQSPADVQALLLALQKRRLLTPAEAQAVRPEWILAFFASPLSVRLQKAKRVLREQPFNWLMDESVLVQGIIDCAFYEEGLGWVIIDFKTDRLPPGGLTELTERYRGQLDHYRRALADITHEPVAECWLSLLRLKKDIALYGV